MDLRVDDKDRACNDRDIKNIDRGRCQKRGFDFRRAAVGARGRGAPRHPPTRHAPRPAAVSVDASHPRRGCETKAALSESGATLAKLCWTSSISAGVICLFIFLLLFTV